MSATPAAASRANPPRCITRRRLGALSIATMMAAMLDHGQTIYELAEVSGLHLTTARHYALTLHREGAAYITHWDQDKRGRYTTPAYRLGRKRDAVKPVQDDRTRQRQHRERRAMAATLQMMAGPVGVAA